ncbi:MAG: sigma-70 family RNA polymerase sigma factor [Fimbriimonadaceae bacterium]|nr:sigma-70 family RNA polymerase sigma factor [Fimbriimonadaceae bacterium]
MERATFERELEKILGLAYGYAVRLHGGDRDAAEDLLQEASVSAFRGRDNFMPGTNFKAWFFKILTNAFYRQGGKKELETVSLDADPEPYLYLQAKEAGISASDDPAEVLFNKIDVVEVKNALDNLPSEFREVSALYFTGEMSYEEISETLDIPVGTVRSRLHRARKLLQVALWDLAVSRGIVEAVSYA